MGNEVALCKLRLVVERLFLLLIEQHSIPLLSGVEQYFLSHIIYLDSLVKFFPLIISLNLGDILDYNCFL